MKSHAAGDFARDCLVFLKDRQVSRFGWFAFEFWVLRFRFLDARFSRFGCFVLPSSFSSASFSKLPFFGSYGSLHPFNRQVNKPWESCHVAICYSRNFSRLQRAVWLNSWICQFSQVNVSKHTVNIRMIVFPKFMGFWKLQPGEAMDILIMLPLFPKSSTILPF